MVGLWDLRARGQSDVMSAERRGVFGDLRVSRFLQSGEGESQCGWCVVSSFASVSISLSQLEFWSADCRLPSFDLLRCREIYLLYLFFFWSDQIGFSLFFGREGHRLAEKLLLLIFIFWQISSTFHYARILCAETPFFHFEESLSTDNIRWMLSWALVTIIILCIR